MHRYTDTQSMVDATCFLVLAAERPQEQQRTSSNKHTYCTDLGGSHRSPTKGAKALEKWLILGLGQKVYKINLSDHVVTERKDVLQNQQTDKTPTVTGACYTDPRAD